MEGLWALPVASLAAGDSHSAALTMNGFLFSWGANDKGQLGLPKNAEAAAQVCTQHLSVSWTLSILCGVVSGEWLKSYGTRHSSPRALAARSREPTASGSERGGLSTNAS